MASSPPPPSPSPRSASNSQNSATQPTPPVLPKEFVKVESASENGVHNVVEQKPDMSHFQILDSEEYINKFKKYEADYTQWLKAKYFSKKNLYGGDIFNDKMTIDDETIMSSRWPCTRSFADPVKGFEEQGSSGSTSTPETL